LNAVMVIRARGENPAERFVINPARLAEEIVACGGGVYDRQEGSKSQLRFSENGKDAFRLEDVSYKCAFSNVGCPSSIRIRHWAPAHGAAANANTNANANANNINNNNNNTASARGDPARPQRRCVECGRKGHRKQCCCDEPGNCRIELVWAHTHSLDAVPPPAKSGRKRPSMRTSAPQKKPRTAADAACPAFGNCVCSKLGESVREGKRQLTAAQSAVRALQLTLSNIETGNAALDAELRSVASRTTPLLPVQVAININMNHANANARQININANANRNSNSNNINDNDNNARLSEDAQRTAAIEKLRAQINVVMTSHPQPRVVSQPPAPVPGGGVTVIRGVPNARGQYIRTQNRHNTHVHGHTHVVARGQRQPLLSRPQAPTLAPAPRHTPQQLQMHQHQRQAPRVNGAPQPKKADVRAAGPTGSAGAARVPAPGVTNVLSAQAAQRK